MSLLGCRSSASEKVCFWCPLKYSNWEILGNFIWSCNSGRGQLGTWKSWLFAPKWGGQCEGRWESAFHVFRVSLNLSQCHIINFGPQDACLKSMYQEMFHNQGRKTRVLNCGAQGRCISRESMDRGDYWISLVWPDWIFANVIKLSWVTGGLSDWVASGSGFLFFSRFIK